MKNILIDFVQFKLHATVIWREKVAASYPKDGERNMRAAELLREFANADHDSIEPKILIALDPFVGSPALNDAITEAARESGFKFKPNNLNELLRIVQAKLGVMAVAA